MQFFKNTTLLIGFLLTTQSACYLTLSAAQEGSKENSVSSSHSDQKTNTSNEGVFKEITKLLLENKETIKKALRDDKNKNKIDNCEKLVSKNFPFFKEKACDFIEEFYAGINIDKYAESSDYEDIKDTDFFKRWKNYFSEENYSIISNVLLPQDDFFVSDAHSFLSNDQASQTSSTQSRQSNARVAGSLLTTSSESNDTLNITLDYDPSTNQQMDRSSTLPQNNSQAGTAFYQAPTVAGARSTKRERKSRNTKKANKNRRGRSKTRSYHRNANATKLNNTPPYYLCSIKTSIVTSPLSDLSTITDNGIAAPNQAPISSLHEMRNLIQDNTDTEDATITTNPNLNHQNHQERDRQNDISTHSLSALIPITNTVDLDVLESDDEDEQKAEVYDNITPGKQTDSPIKEIVEEDIDTDRTAIFTNDNPKKSNNRNDKNFSLVIIIVSAISVFAGFATLFHKLAEQPTKDTKLSDKGHIKSKKADKT